MKEILSQSQQTVKGATYATSIIEVNSASLKVDSKSVNNFTTMTIFGKDL
jgi:hypothetical protein